MLTPNSAGGRERADGPGRVRSGTSTRHDTTYAYLSIVVTTG